MAESREEKCAIRLRRIRADNPGWSTDKNVKWQAKNPEKRRAHKIVEYALKVGRLCRQPCERCGQTKNIQAHHDNYSRPLDVMWLCQLHHRERHRELDRELSAAQGGSVPAHDVSSLKLTPAGGSETSAGDFSIASTPILQVTATNMGEPP